MRPTGLFLIAVALAVPGYWFAALAGKHDAGAVFSQYLGACALIAMAIAQVLATRMPGLQTVFGGLDRIYVLHKWLGILAMALIVLHDTIDAEMDGLGAETALTEIAETFGEVSLYGLLVLVTLSVATFVPYHLWKYTHKLMGGFFAAATLHYAFIQKPFALGDPLGLYILAFCVAGIVAYIHTLLPSGALKGWRSYKVDSVELTGGALSVVLSPKGRGLRHRAGQFAFISFDVPDREEAHPFTISAAPAEDRRLRFTIKGLGDYTGRLGEVIRPGVTARVSGPFGHFRMRRGADEQVWIASGVGITPFVAWAQALAPSDGPVHLFYSTRTRETAPHLAELEALAAAKPNLNLHLVQTRTDGRLTGERIAAVVGRARSRTRVAFCGPKDMRRALKSQLAAEGFSPGRFQYEEFEIRSGLGLRRLFRMLAGRAGQTLDTPVRSA